MTPEGLMKRIGVAIIGCGNIAKNHVEAYLAFPDRCRILAVCDIYKDKAREFAARYAVQDVDVEEDYHELLSRADIDLVSICLPPSQHCQVSMDFMQAGKDVVCEKPMAASLEEADRMNRMAEQTGRLLSVISQNRYKNDLFKVKRLLDSRVLGRVLMVRVNSMWYRGSNYYDLWWRGTWENEGGGCTLNHSVHQIDLLNHLVGKPLSVLSVIDNLNHDNSEVEDASISILRYPRMLAQIDVTLCDHDEKQEILIITENATISVPWSLHAVRQLPNGFFEVDEKAMAAIQKRFDAIPDLMHEGHDGQILNVLKAISKEEVLEVSGHDGRNALELIYAIYQSATEKREVELPLDRNSAFYTKEGMLRVVPKFFKKTKSVDNLSGEITLGRN
ncbi:MAG: Gfo/Idh/MocA family oxidoreductase [Sphaerochaeta sp.]|nr:MAG: Gfo/Idh/MocA family oxidoreductase [Sphaerochaeta sp.]